MVDKGVAMVVLDKLDYLNKAQDVLVDKDTYRSIHGDPTSMLKNKLIQPLRNIKAQRGLNNYIYKRLYPTSAQSSMVFPKIINKAPPQTHCF